MSATIRIDIPVILSIEVQAPDAKIATTVLDEAFQEANASDPLEGVRIKLAHPNFTEPAEGIIRMAIAFDKAKAIK